VCQNGVAWRPSLIGRCELHRSVVGSIWKLWKVSELSGHYGWVKKVEYWGPNTVISASTDRSVALWDTRVRNSPLFMLRHHFAPVSDLLVGPRSDPVVISAAADGRVAAWYFRRLTGTDDSSPPSTANKKEKLCHSVRNPAGHIVFAQRQSTSPGAWSSLSQQRCLS